MNKKLFGIFIPVVTPFIKEEVSFDRYELNIQKWNTTPLGGYMVLGSNGEFCSLTDEEACSIVKLSSEAKASDKALIVGAGRESLYKIQKFIEKIAEYNIDYLSILPPSYFKNAMTDSVIIDFYTKVADFSPIPITIYCAPSFTNGVTISKKAVSELSLHKNILGIKDTSSNMMLEYCEAVSGREDFTILSGSLENFICGIENGARGGVLSAANYMPLQCCRLFEILFNKTNDANAKNFIDDFFDLYRNTSKKYGVAGVKACMDINGYFGMDLRAPLKKLDDSTMNELSIIFKKLFQKIII